MTKEQQIQTIKDRLLSAADSTYRIYAGFGGCTGGGAFIEGDGECSCIHQSVPGSCPFIIYCKARQDAIHLGILEPMPAQEN